MKTKLITAALLSATLASATLSLAQAAPKESTFEVGAGAMISDGQQNDISVLIRVDFDGFKSPEISKTQWILAKIRAHSGVSTSNSEGKLDYADIEFETMRGQVNLNDKNFMALAMGTLNYERNLALGNDETITFSVAGLNVRTGAAHSSGLEFYIESAVNLIGAGYSMSSKGVESEGMGIKTKYELGFLFGNRFTIAGGLNSTIISSGLSKKACKPVETTEDPSGSNTSICTFDQGKNGESKRYLGDAYVKAVLKLNENLSLFGEMHNQVYSITSRSHEGQKDREEANQYFMGISGQF